MGTASCSAHMADTDAVPVTRDEESSSDDDGELLSARAAKLSSNSPKKEAAASPVQSQDLRQLPARIYLECPYGEKAQCKSLGGRWDPQEKKWYVPLGKDTTPFAKWLLAPPLISPYLESQYREKDAVKALGARWDHQEKKWYVPPGRDTTPFARWLPAHQPSSSSVPTGVKRAATNHSRGGDPVKKVKTGEAKKKVRTSEAKKKSAKEDPVDEEVDEEVLEQDRYAASTLQRYWNGMTDTYEDDYFGLSPSAMLRKFRRVVHSSTHNYSNPIGADDEENMMDAFIELSKPSRKRFLEQAALTISEHRKMRLEDVDRVVGEDPADYKEGGQYAMTDEVFAAMPPFAQMLYRAGFGR